jgi:hypothetical protein
MLVLERIDGSRNREIRLAGTGGADAEGKIVIAHRPHVRGLVGAPRPDTLQARLDREVLLVVAGFRGRFRLRFALIHNRFLQENVHALRIEALAIRHPEKPVQHITAELGRSWLPGDAKVIAATGDLDIEAAFNLPQVFIELATEIGQTVVVGGLENDIP